MEVGHWLVRMDWRPAELLVRLPLVILPNTIKSRRSFLLALAHLGSPGKRAVNGCVCVCVIFPKYQKYEIWQVFLKRINVKNAIRWYDDHDETLLFWHAPLGVRSAIRRHQPPQRAVLSQIGCLGQYEVGWCSSMWCRDVLMVSSSFLEGKLLGFSWHLHHHPYVQCAQIWRDTVTELSLLG